MSATFHCAVCDQAYQVLGQKDEQEHLLGSQETFRCITPLCGGRLNRSNVRMDSKAVPLHQFFRAVNGFGFAEGNPASMRKVKQTLLEKKIVEVHAEDVGDPKRTIIHRLVMEDGTRLHFASSGRGACVYYVEEQGPTCVEVFDGAEDVRAAHENARESSLEDGEEARRDLEDAEGERPRLPGPEDGLHGPGLPALHETRGVPHGVRGPAEPGSDEDLRVHNNDEAVR